MEKEQKKQVLDDEQMDEVAGGIGQRIGLRQDIQQETGFIPN
ncbi:MAG: hypothetical protein ACI3Y0_08755 [Prevotella sp.]